MRVKFVQYQVFYDGKAVSMPFPFHITEEIVQYLELKYYDLTGGKVTIERLDFYDDHVIGEVINASER